jgi:hypothetical protein
VSQTSRIPVEEASWTKALQLATSSGFIEILICPPILSLLVISSRGSCAFIGRIVTWPVINADPEFGPPERSLVFGFEQGLWEFRLSNDAPQGSTSDRIVKEHRNGYRRALPTLLHDSVAALLPDCGKSGLFEDPTNL